MAIGPYCVIEGRVRIGTGTRLKGHVHLQGPVTLGSDNTLYPFVCIGYEPQDLKFTGETAGVVIGDRNVIREGTTIHAATNLSEPTRVGCDNLMMNNSHIGHDAAMADRCVLVSGVVIGGHVRIANQVTFGGNSGIHQHCRVGRLTMIGGISAASKDVPPFSLVAARNELHGVNLIGLRRNGVARPVIDAVKRAFRTLYLQGHINPVAADLIEKQAATDAEAAPLLMELVDFIRTSQRGIIPHHLQTTPQGPLA